MSEWGWLEEPQEWRAIPNEAGKRCVSGKSSVKHKLDMIVKAGAARRAFLLRREPLEGRTKLKKRGGWVSTSVRQGWVHLRGTQAAW
jgi:hypothetical protein